VVVDWQVGDDDWADIHSLCTAAIQCSVNWATRSGRFEYVKSELSLVPSISM
jgi:hypothetical protein